MKGVETMHTGSKEIGIESALFVDDRLIRESSGVVRRLHPGNKHPEPVVLPDRPWEGERVYIFGSVMFDREREMFRMWYSTRLGPGYEDRAPGIGRHGDQILYAESDDGIHWEKPALGRHVFDGSDRNNVIVRNRNNPSIFFDEQAPSKERYKMIAWNWEEGMFGYWSAFSEDGVNWQEYSSNPVFTDSREVLEVSNIARDPKSGEYFVYHRRWGRPGDYLETAFEKYRSAGGHLFGDYRDRRRLIAVTKSSDFQNWSAPELVVIPDAEDDRWCENERQKTEFYNMSGFAYAGQYLGLLQVFRITDIRKPHEAVSRANQSPWDGPLHSELTHSRDGHSWQRLEDRLPIIPRGHEGSFDAGCILAVQNKPFTYGDEVRAYYTGINTTHGAPVPPKRVCIGLASWRRDGFVSLDANSTPGVIETVPLYSKENRLYVSANAANGRLAIELLSEEGNVREGYSHHECVPVESDDVSHEIRWKERYAIDGTVPFRLRFHLKEAQLYSFRMGNTTSDLT